MMSLCRFFLPEGDWEVRPSLSSNIIRMSDLHLTKSTLLDLASELRTEASEECLVADILEALANGEWQGEDMEGFPTGIYVRIKVAPLPTPNPNALEEWEPRQE